MEAVAEQGGEQAYLPGAAALVEQIDTRVLIVLRDGRHLEGTLRSFDQYMNLVLEDTVERIIYSGKYCDMPLGLFLVRGDNIVLLGEVDVEKRLSQNLEQISPEKLSELLAEGAEAPAQQNWDFE